MQRHQLLDERQPNPRAGHAVDVFTHVIAEHFEKLLLVVLADTHPLVGYLDNSHVAMALYAHFYHFADGRIFEGIANQIEHNLVELATVGPQQQLLLSALKAVVGLVVERDIVEIVHHAFHEGHQVNPAHPHMHLVALYLVQVEYLVGELQHTVGVVAYHR